MNLGLFGSQTDFQKRIVELQSYLENSMGGLDAISHALKTRSTLERDYRQGCNVLLNELKRKGNSLKNPELRKSVDFIWRDWEAAADQNARLGKEFAHIAEQEIKPFADKYRNHIKRWFESLHGTEERAVDSCDMYKGTIDILYYLI